jgi:hypothetical protein
LRRFQTRNGPQQSALATSAATDNGDKFTGGNFNVEVLEHGASTKRNADTFDCD